MHTTCILGLGYIGLPTAALLASHGKSVVGVDVNEQIVNTINSGVAHITEPGLAALLLDVVHRGLLRATVTPVPADVFLIAVPTPLGEGYTPNRDHIRIAAQNLAPVLAKNALIILESTSPVGTTEQLARWLAAARPDLTFPHQAGDEADVHLAYCPERVLPGRTLIELVANDRIIGGLSSVSAEKAESFYRIFVSGTITRTEARTAELCKLVENSFRDVSIAFANELSIICDKLGIDVWELIRFANRHPRVNILQPGAGVGGHCIAVDPWFVIDGAPDAARLIRTAREVNESKPLWLLEKIQPTLTDVLAANPGKTMADLTVACLGLTFKPDIDDLRESPAVHIARKVTELGCRVLAVDPYVHTLPSSLAAPNIRLASLEEALSSAHVTVVLVRHTCFLKDAASVARQEKVIDAVGLLSVQL